MWERACSRKRCARQHRCRLTLPLREQARSHRVRCYAGLTWASQAQASPDNILVEQYCCFLQGHPNTPRQRNTHHQPRSNRQRLAARRGLPLQHSAAVSTLVVAERLFGSQLRVGHKVLVGHRANQQVAQEPQHQQAREDVQRDVVSGSTFNADAQLIFTQVVHQHRPQHARRRPRGQQTTVDRADHLRTEQVREVGRNSRKTTAVHRQDDAERRSAFCIILSMYGGGFATVPAYLADLFGTQMVGAIHGRLLTAWAAAGVLGPVLVNYLREYQLSIGVERAAAYDITLYILAGLLVLGFICNLLVRPVADKYFMTDAELAAEQALGHDKGATASTSLEWKASSASVPLAIVAWLAVGIPLAWGVWVTLQKTAVLFH